MTLSRALISAHSGLASAGVRAGVTSNNIANALTPGYVRRGAQTTENVVAGRGSGVGATLITRNQDLMLSRSRRDAGGDLAMTHILASSYGTLNSAIGQPGDDYGLFASVEGLESSFRDLLNAPESAAYQQSVLSAVRETASTINQLAELGNQMRQQADQDIDSAVSEINSALHQIHRLNRDIAGLNTNAGEGAALEDERQRMIDKIAQYIPVRDIPNDNGQIDIITQDGVYLLAGSVREVEFEPAGLFTEAHTYSKTGSILSGLSVGGQDITPGRGLAHGINSAELAGLFAVRDETIPQFTDRLDTFAADLIARFSDPSVDPTLNPGEPGIFVDGRQALGADQLNGAARHIRINAAIDPDQGGETRRLRDGLGSTTPGPVGQTDIVQASLNALVSGRAAPQGSALAGHVSSIEFAAGLTSQVGEQTLRYDALTSGNQSRFQILSDAEISETGVDTDFEMQQLLLIEQAYAANARVIQTVSDMIDRLMQI